MPDGVMEAPNSTDHASNPWDAIWTGISDDGLRGYVSSFDAADRVRELFQAKSSVMFFIDSKKNTELHLDCTAPSPPPAPGPPGFRHRVRFADIGEAVVPSDGVPFISSFKRQYGCMFGRDKHASKKRRASEERNSALKEDHPVPVKRKYKLLQPSRRKGCPAVLDMKEVIRFPEFEIAPDASSWKKKAISKQIREALSKGEKLRSEKRIYIKLPSCADHQEIHDVEQQVYQEPVSPCSLCSGVTSSSSAPVLSAEAVELEGAQGDMEHDETTLRSADQSANFVNLLNSLPESELKTLKYINSKMAAGIITHREERGQFSTLEELLVIPGVGRRTLDKLQASFANEKLEKGSTRIDPQSTSITDLSHERLSNLQDVVSVDVGLKHIAWLHMDKDRWVRKWHCKMIEGISPGKWDPINYLRLISDTVEEMPRPDLYVLEHKSFTSLNKGTFQTMLFVRCLESMLYTSLNSDLMDSGEVKAISLPQNVVGRHFDLLVGTQRKSGQTLAKALLEEGYERRNAWYPVRIGFENLALFRDVNKYKREHLANCLLLATAFYDIHVDKKPGFKMK